MNYASSSLIHNDIALLEIGDFLNISALYDKASYLNQHLDCIGRQIAEIRFIKNTQHRIEQTIDELSRNFSIVLVSGSFGFHKNHHVVNAIANIFNTEVEANSKAKEVYLKYLVKHGIEYKDYFEKSFILPRNSSVFLLEDDTENEPSGGLHFGFRYANIICCDETNQTMMGIIHILRDIIGESYCRSLRHIITSVPVELFYEKLDMMAKASGVSHYIYRHNSNYHKIVVQHENAHLLVQFIIAVKGIIGEYEK